MWVGVGLDGRGIRLDTQGYVEHYSKESNSRRARSYCRRLCLCRRRIGNWIESEQQGMSFWAASFPGLVSLRIPRLLFFAVKDRESQCDAGPDAARALEERQAGFKSGMVMRGLRSGGGKEFLRRVVE